MTQAIFELAAKHHLRVGQFISNAIQDYLKETGRNMDDTEVGNYLFYIDDLQLQRLLESYDELLDSKGKMYAIS